MLVQYGLDAVDEGVECLAGIVFLRPERIADLLLGELTGGRSKQEVEELRLKGCKERERRKFLR